MSKYYQFSNCGCRVLIDEHLPSIYDRPSLIYPTNVQDIPEDCVTTWEMISAGLTKGVFQLESPLGRHWAKTLKPGVPNPLDGMEHLAALGALLRPGTLRNKDEHGISMTEHYCLRKNCLEETSYFHNALKPILERTYGVLVYQEQSISIASQLAGFSLSEADSLRKCVLGTTHFISKTRGWITINELLEHGYHNDEFLVMGKNGVQQWKKISKIWSTGKHDVRKIESNSGFAVWATKYHQFLTSYGWKARIRLKEDDNLIGCRNISYEGKDLISSDMALVIAGIICEGYFVDKTATFVNHDENMMNKFLDAYYKVFNKNPWTSLDGRVVRLAINERQKLSEYINYGLSDSRKIPSVMMGMSLESTTRFLSYMLACEGGVSQSGQYEFASKSYEMAYQVKLLLLRFGIRSLLLSYPEKDRFRLYVNDIEDQKILLEKLTGEWSDCKKEALKNILDNKSSGNFTTDTFPSHLTVKMIDQYPSCASYESGDVYHCPLSRKRFLRLAQRTEDDYWIGLTNGNQTYEPIKSMNNKIRQVETFDFTIDDEETPYIIANGLVIHNSIGKKDTELMHKVKSQFIDKAESVGIITRIEAEEIFSWIEKGQRYLFNKAHSVEYAYIGYHTAHLKAHFPLEFYTSYLYYAQEKQDPLLEIKQLINDAKVCGIGVIPPRFEDMNTHFSILDSITISFGLSDVKGIGESYIKKMRENAEITEQERGLPRSQWSWLDFLVYFSPTCSSNVVKRMIEVGALSKYKLDRQRMLAEYEAYAGLSEREQHKISSLRAGGYHDGLNEVHEIIQQLLDQPKGVATIKRKDKVNALLHLIKNPPRPLTDTIDWITKTEEECLGVSLTCNRVDGVNSIRANCTCEEFKAGKMNEDIIMIAEIQDFRELKIKNGKNAGKSMAFLTVCDSSGSLEDVTLFSEAWENHSNLIRTGCPIVLQGRRDYKRDAFIVEQVQKV